MSPLLFKRLSDESLGSRLASGEAAAFDELYRRYAHRLAAYGSHLLGDAASGDDVAQAAMLKAYAALRDGRVPDRMKPWLFRIAHNAAIDLVARRRELPSDNLPEQASADHEPFAGALVEALATLPERQRRVYVLREVHGLRMDETAAELDLNISQVEQALFAARNRLAEQLVFGDRLNCVTVQRLASGPLDTAERRALKTHLHSCASCRGALGMRGRALSLFPSGVGFEWLRGLSTALIGGGAPVVAKVGAVVATATIAAGVPVAVENANRHHAHRAALRAQPATPVSTPAPSAFTEHTTVLASAAVPAVALTAGSHDTAQHTEADHATGNAREPAKQTERGDGSGGSSGGSVTSEQSHEAATPESDGQQAAASPHVEHSTVTEADRQQSERTSADEHAAQTSTVATDQHSGDQTDPPETGDGSDGHSTTTIPTTTTTMTTTTMTTTTTTTTAILPPLPVPAP